MQITDIKVRKLFNEGPMRAIVSVTFDGQLAVHDIKVINAREKYFIVMPSRKNPDETYRDIVHPINAQFRATLEAAVIEAYEQELAAEAARGDHLVGADDLLHDLGDETAAVGSQFIPMLGLPCIDFVQVVLEDIPCQ